MAEALTDLPDGRLSALRNGQRLVAEVPASDGTRRAWVSVSPIRDEADIAAAAQGWVKSRQNRRFRVRHDEFSIAHLDSWDYDVGQVVVADTTVDGEADLAASLRGLGVPLDRLDYPWHTDFPL